RRSAGAASNGQKASAESSSETKVNIEEIIARCRSLERKERVYKRRKTSKASRDSSVGDESSRSSSRSSHRDAPTNDRVPRLPPNNEDVHGATADNKVDGSATKDVSLETPKQLEESSAVQPSQGLSLLMIIYPKKETNREVVIKRDLDMPATSNECDKTESSTDNGGASAESERRNTSTPQPNSSDQSSVTGLCAYCPKEFATSRGVREHERRSHESRLFLDAEHLVCPHCEQEFQNKRNRDEHVKRHSNPNSVIGRGF
ncbi:hypothetical protein GCK32_016410, partial [Trichostrongylus colubriformis]